MCSVLRLPHATASLPLLGFPFANDRRQPISAEKVNVFTQAVRRWSDPEDQLQLASHVDEQRYRVTDGFRKDIM